MFCYSIQNHSTKIHLFRATRERWRGQRHVMNRVQDVVDLRTKSSSNLEKRADLLPLMMNASTSNEVTVS